MLTPDLFSESLALLVDRMPMGIAFFDADLLLRRCNPTWAGFIARYSPLTAAQVEPGAHLFDLLPDAQTLVLPIINEVRAGETVQKKAFSLGREATESYWDMVFAPYIEAGQVVGIINMATDVTGQFRAEEGRREAERRRRVAESLRDILTVLNSNRSLDEILGYIMAQACHLLGSAAAAIYQFHPAEQALTVQASIGLPPDYRDLRIPMEVSIATQAMQTLRPVVVIDADKHPEDAAEALLSPDQHQILERVAQQFRAILGVPLVIKGEIYGGITLHYAEARQFSNEEIDLAASFADQAALAIENARLRTQTEQAAAAAERSRLARDLHDAVTQTLFSTSLIAEVLPRLWERNQPEARRRLEELRQLTRGALAEMRTLLLELRPSALADAPLPDLLRQLAEAVHGRARVPVNLTVTGEGVLPPDIKIAFYRIAQEALNNIIKHAGVRQAAVQLHQTGAAGQIIGVELCVVDDGSGFDAAAVSPEHLGLKIMRERAEAVGAVLRVDSRPGAGTTITATWSNNERESL